MKIDHLGIAVKSLDERLAFWRDGLGLAVSGVEEIASERVKVAFLEVGQSRIELLEPTDPDSVVARFMARRGEGLHHVCIAVPDLAVALARLKAQGARLIDEVPRVGAGGSRVAFVHPEAAGGVLIELKEKP